MGLTEHLSPENAARVETIALAFVKAGIPEADVERALLDSVTVSGEPRAEYDDVMAAFSGLYKERFPPLSAFVAGATVPFGAYAVVDYLCASTPTIAAGFELLGRYIRLVRAGLELRPVETPTSVRVLLAEMPGSESWFSDEWTMGVTLGRFRQVTGPAFRPSRLCFRRPRPNDETAVKKAADLFGCELAFEESEAAFEFAPAVWRLPIHTRDPRMGETLERHARELLAEARVSSSLKTKTREIIATDLAKGEPPIDAVAKKLAMTPRTLQRRLRDEGTTFKAVLEGLRADLAERYLRDKRVGITEVAFLLGYADASAFARAHKRWRGSSPAATRRQ